MRLIQSSGCRDRQARLQHLRARCVQTQMRGAATQLIQQGFPRTVSQGAITVEHAQLTRLGEVGLTAVDTAAERGLCGVHLARPLQRRATGQLRGATAGVGSGVAVESITTISASRTIEGGAVLEAGISVTIQGAAALLAQIGQGREFFAFGQPMHSVQTEHAQSIGHLVRSGEDAAIAPLQHRIGYQAIASKHGIGQGKAEIQINRSAAMAALGEELANLRGRKITPAVFLEQVASEIQATLISCLTCCTARRKASFLTLTALEFDASPPKTPARELELTARMIQTILGAQIQRPTQGVQTKQRVGTGNQLHTGQGGTRHQVPVHYITKRFVQAHAVLKHRQSLRGAQQRAGGEAAKVHIRLIRVALDFIHRYPGQLAVEQRRQGGPTRPLQRCGINAAHRIRQCIPRQSQARYRGGADHLQHGGCVIGR